MKQFIIKYTTYDGVDMIKTVEAMDKDHASKKLINCREVVWIREKRYLSANFIHIHSVKNK